MISIVNNKKDVQIFINDKDHGVTITPKTYEDDFPSILIELKNVDFIRHALKCNECKELYNDFNTNTTDWFLHFNGKKHRLDLSQVGKGREKNLVSYQRSEFFSGTKLKFLISTETPESLTAELRTSEEQEDYEYCAFLRDRIIDIEKD